MHFLIFVVMRFIWWIVVFWDGSAMETSAEHIVKSQLVAHSVVEFPSPDPAHLHDLDRPHGHGSDHKRESESVQWMTQPESHAVLVAPRVPFMGDEKSEKRLMRPEAAEALEELFFAAEADGIELVGISAYRSYERQKELFHYYAERDGKVKAQTYSALPGESEHQTGLAVDVAGKGSDCVVEDCFAQTEEAKWLAEHAWKFGFIVRYPEGKEEITGYKYEPWHLRYVGREMAETVT